MYIKSDTLFLPPSHLPLPLSLSIWHREPLYVQPGSVLSLIFWICFYIFILLPFYSCMLPWAQIWKGQPRSPNNRQTSQHIKMIKYIYTRNVRLTHHLVILHFPFLTGKLFWKQKQAKPVVTISHSRSSYFFKNQDYKGMDDHCWIRILQEGCAGFSNRVWPLWHWSRNTMSIIQPPVW